MSKNIHWKKRPHFLINNCPITAAGLLIIDYEKHKCLLQYIPEKNKYDDFGGKVDIKDNTIIDTIVREVYEESNKLIGSENNPIDFSKIYFCYMKKCKYLLAVIESKYINIDKNLKIYGKIETHTNINRLFKWVNIFKILSWEKKVNRRLEYYFNNEFCKNFTPYFKYNFKYDLIPQYIKKPIESIIEKPETSLEKTPETLPEKTPESDNLSVKIIQTPELTPESIYEIEEIQENEYSWKYFVLIGSILGLTIGGVRLFLKKN